MMPHDELIRKAVQDAYNEAEEEVDLEKIEPVTTSLIVGGIALRLAAPHIIRFALRHGGKEAIKRWGPRFGTEAIKRLVTRGSQAIGRTPVAATTARTAGKPYPVYPPVASAAAKLSTKQQAKVKQAGEKAFSKIFDRPGVQKTAVLRNQAEKARRVAETSMMNSLGKPVVGRMLESAAKIPGVRGVERAVNPFRSRPLGTGGEKLLSWRGLGNLASPTRSWTGYGMQAAFVPTYARTLGFGGDDADEEAYQRAGQPQGFSDEPEADEESYQRIVGDEIGNLSQQQLADIRSSHLAGDVRSQHPEWDVMPTGVSAGEEEAADPAWERNLTEAERKHEYGEGPPKYEELGARRYNIPDDPTPAESRRMENEQKIRAKGGLLDSEYHYPQSQPSPSPSVASTQDGKGLNPFSLGGSRRSPHMGRSGNTMHYYQMQPGYKVSFQNIMKDLINNNSIPELSVMSMPTTAAEMPMTVFNESVRSLQDQDLPSIQTTSKEDKEDVEKITEGVMKKLMKAPPAASKQDVVQAIKTAGRMSAKAPLGTGRQHIELPDITGQGSGEAQAIGAGVISDAVWGWLGPMVEAWQDKSRERKEQSSARAEARKTSSFDPITGESGGEGDDIFTASDVKNLIFAPHPESGEPWPTNPNTGEPMTPEQLQTMHTLVTNDPTILSTKKPDATPVMIPVVQEGA